MLTLMSIVVPLAIVAIVAIVARYLDLKDIYGNPRRITGKEYAVFTVVLVGISFLVTLWIGPTLARNSAINGYHEFYNGSVTESVVLIDECHRDGSCNHHYTCDHEEEDIPQYNSKGELTGYTHVERDHQCPYATHELSYVLNTNIGKTITIADGYFEAHPEEWRSGHGIPSDVPREPPDRWIVAKQDLESGKSDPVTGVFDYANFILASDDDLYKQYDGDVEALKKASLLPEHTAKLGDSDMLFDYNMQAMKVQAVGGLKLANLGVWQNRLMRFNAALGSDLRGDMHVVLVPASKVSDPDSYITALKAYWTNLGKWSISKNGIILAIGASPDGKTVEWARAETGMPKGNGSMISAVMLRLNGEPLDPGVLLGDVSTSVRKDGDDIKVVYDHDAAGSIGKIVFTDFPFERACMKCEDEGESDVGYVDLKDEVPLTTGSKIWMFVIVFLMSLGLGVSMLFIDFKSLISEYLNTVKANRRNP